MIKPGEIQKKAREIGVRDQQIEKDYILSWILLGISQHQRLAAVIVFKGGTVLKKVYFEDYRFSEDLDFTLMNNEITNDQIFEWFNEAFEYVKEEANIPLSIAGNNQHEDGGVNFYINYSGPLGGLAGNKKVKVDISRSEKLEYKPVMNAVILNYTDLEEHQLLCFHMKEFEQKCASKNLKAADFHKKLSERLAQYKSRWQRSMNEQIKDLPSFEKVEREVQRHLKKLKIH